MKRQLFLLSIALLLLPAMAVGQSDVTRRVSASEMGYRGQVKMVQSTEFSMDSANKFFVTTAEEYNEKGLRTEMSTIENIYQTDYHYEYDDNGQLVYYQLTDAEGGKDSIVFHYDKNGCLFGYDEYGFSPDPNEGNDVTVFAIVCDEKCRVAQCASVWEDTIRYLYDNAGRLISMTGQGLPEQIVTLHYDQDGRLVKVRSGSKHYEETHYRYDERGDTIELWHTNWEHFEGEKGNREVGEHKYFKYTEYDNHGNWTQATVTVKENRWRYTYSIIRTFGYYE